MRDEKGCYYLAEPGNSSARVYVRQNDTGEIEFRLWHNDYPDIWEQHGWTGYDTLSQAAELYQKERNANAKPLKLYDLNLARAVLGLK